MMETDQDTLKFENKYNQVPMPIEATPKPRMIDRRISGSRIQIRPNPFDG